MSNTPGADIDMRSNTWGRALYGHSKNDDGSWNVGGCLTPLPRAGQTALLANGSVWRFRSVIAWGNPRDGFDAVIEQEELMSVQRGRKVGELTRKIRRQQASRG